MPELLTLAELKQFVPAAEYDDAALGQFKAEAEALVAARAPDADAAIKKGAAIRLVRLIMDYQPFSQIGVGGADIHYRSFTYEREQLLRTLTVDEPPVVFM